VSGHAAARLGRELLSKAREGEGEVVGLDRRGAQSLHGMASLGDGLRRLVDRAAERFLGRGRAPREHLVHSLETQQQSLEALQQRVVQLARDARPLTHARIERHVELAAQVSYAQEVKRPQQCHERQHTERAEPVRLPVRGCDGEIERRAFLVPDAAVVARDDAEAVGAGIEIGVERLPTIARVLPVGIAAFQPVAEAILLGDDETERGVVDLQVAHERWQPHLRRDVIRLAIGDDLLDVHWRGPFVER